VSCTTGTHECLFTHTRLWPSVTVTLNRDDPSLLVGAEPMGEWFTGEGYLSIKVLFLCPGHYSVTHVRNSEIKQLRPLFFSLCLEILTWFLVFECIMMSYRSSLHFVPVQWSLRITKEFQRWSVTYDYTLSY
jgi:hypothetical protein